MVGVRRSLRDLCVCLGADQTRHRVRAQGTGDEMKQLLAVAVLMCMTGCASAGAQDDND